MTPLRSLSLLRTRLPKIIPGTNHVFLRAALVRTAESAAAETPESLVVFARVVEGHIGMLSDDQLMAIHDAISEDLPLEVVDDLAAAVMEGFVDAGGGA